MPLDVVAVEVLVAALLPHGISSSLQRVSFWFLTGEGRRRGEGGQGGGERRGGG